MRFCAIAFPLLFVPRTVQACSPWAPLEYTWQVVGNELQISLTTYTAWACCYTGRIELICIEQGFTGHYNYSTNEVCKGSGGGSATIVNEPYPFNMVTIDLTAYCPGSELQWRAREQGPDGFGPYTPTFSLTVPGVFTPLVAQVSVSPTIVCPGACATLTASASGGCGIITYSWGQGGAGATSTVCPTVPTTYTVTATANNQCGSVQTETATVTLDVTPDPVSGTATIDPPLVCEGEDTNLSLSGYSGTIQWQSATSAAGPWTDLPGATNDTYTFGPVMTETFFQAVVTNDCPSVFSNVVDVGFLPLPPVDFSATTECANAATSFTDETLLPATIIAWDWEFNDGATSSVQDPQHQFGAPGTYPVTLTVSFDNGCFSEWTEDITVLPMPSPDFTSTLACANVGTPITDQSTVVAPSSISQWSWDVNADGVEDYNTETLIHSFGVGGTYNVQLTVTTDDGCTESVTLPVPVTLAPEANFTNSTVCREFATAFTDQSAGNLVSHAWDFGDGNSSTASSPDHFYAAAGSYDVTLTVINDLDCPSTVTMPITVHPKPVASFISSDPESCSPLCIDLASTSTTEGAGIASVLWSFGDGTSSTADYLSPCFYNDDRVDDIAYDLHFIAINLEGCSDTILLEDHLKIYHNPLSLFAANPQTTDMFDREVNLTNQSIGADEYLWELGDGYSSSDLQFNHTYADTGTFVISLTVSTVNGCEDVSSTVFVIPPTINFGVPNAFTPDGDGLNDTFFFTGFGIMDQDFEFQVFNRWGELVYNTTAFQPWDGTYNGTPARDGVYAYRIRYRDTLGATTTKQGHVTLLR